MKSVNKEVAHCKITECICKRCALFVECRWRKHHCQRCSKKPDAPIGCTQHRVHPERIRRGYPVG